MNKFLELIKNTIKDNKLFSIVYYGASTTSFEHIFPNWGEIIRYVLKDSLEEELSYQNTYWNIHTSNRGMSGASSLDFLERLDEYVLELKPSLVFFSGTDNDYFLGVDIDVSKENTKKIIEKLLEKNIKVVFTFEIPSVNEELNKRALDYYEMCKEVAKQFFGNENFIFVDFNKLFPKNLLEKSYTLISPTGNTDIGYGAGELDYVHYNRFGNTVVAKILLKEVFGIDFNHEKFLKDLKDETKKYPSY